MQTFDTADAAIRASGEDWPEEPNAGAVSEASLVLAAAQLLVDWPGGYAIKASPPPADYDRPTMRAYATKSRPHIVNPKRPTHTLCGKRTDWWVMVATALADWPAEKFTECGCANCARIAGRLGLA